MTHIILVILVFVKWIAKSCFSSEKKKSENQNEKYYSLIDGLIWATADRIIQNFHRRTKSLRFFLYISQGQDHTRTGTFICTVWTFYSGLSTRCQFGEILTVNFLTRPRIRWTRFSLLKIDFNNISLFMTALTFIDTHTGYFSSPKNWSSPKLNYCHQNRDKTISYNDSH